MFFSSPNADLRIIVFLLIIVFLISIAAYFFSRKILESIFVMSLLSNLVFYLNSGSRLFDMYKIKWVVIFTLNIWPYINIALLILITFNYFRKINEENKKI
ncbi:MAG: hypothetical protein ACD_11C00024G0021 [uncultured bacterium]|nr:MAG: hypothetical protein ACD_11C00024G0021 [uncultured bacterium]HBR71943.1 hypothetical protein [Candidatus Moranbacteria bacterium]